MAKKVSVVIPNYNGLSILQKNLPEVLETCKGCEILVVDDGSTDESVKFLKNIKGIKLIVQPQNRGFAATVNNGVKNTSGDLVLLLNSDVSPIKGFIEPLLKHFENNKDLFAAGIADKSHENGKIAVRGKGGARVKLGLIEHFALPPATGETLWVSGGSGLYDREKFQQLGGFDTLYAPFYWEDIDLSYRARKAGYFCLFEPKSQVDHYHEEGAIKKTRPEKFIRTISYKNQLLFFWKNISDPIYILQHLFFLPYHFAIALLNLDTAFFIGFFKATLQIPALILNYDRQHPESKLTDREILKSFEKP